MSKTLLLADDSVTIQKVVGISFASEDVKLVTVDNGDDALARARELRPDVVLADVVMPGKNGYELCEALKADPALAHIPVLLLTGTFEAFDEERAQAAGAAGHVAKPFEAQALVQQVNRLLAEAPAPAPAGAGDTAAVIDKPTNPEVAAAPRDDDDAGDAFDFFDDELGDVAESDGASVSSAEETSLALDEPDSAFAFGEPDLGGEPLELDVATPVPVIDAEASFSDASEGPLTVDDDADEAPFESLAPAPPPLPAQDSTVAILPDLPGDSAQALELAAAPAGAVPDLAAELEPAGAGRDFDDTPEPLDDEPEPLDASATDDDLAFAFESPAAAPGEAPGADPDMPPIGADDFAEAAVLDPNGASGFDVSSSDLGEPAELLAPPEPERIPVETPPAPERPLGVEPPPFEPPPMAPARESAPPALPAAGGGSAAARQAAEALEAVAPQLRRELHDTLEKVAWESFDGVAQKLVSDAVERVEKIAWEIVPQLAESLIREELRRLKGED